MTSERSSRLLGTRRGARAHCHGCALQGSMRRFIFNAPAGIYLLKLQLFADPLIDARRGPNDPLPQAPHSSTPAWSISSARVGSRPNLRFSEGICNFTAAASTNSRTEVRCPVAGSHNSAGAGCSQPKVQESGRLTSSTWVKSRLCLPPVNSRGLPVLADMNRDGSKRLSCSPGPYTVNSRAVKPLIR